MSDAPARPPLDPDAQRFLEKLNAAGLPTIDRRTVAEARLIAASTVVTADPVATVRELQIPSGHGPIAARLYRHRTQAQDPAAPQPGIVFFHGGGWVLGSLDSHDSLCRRMCRMTHSTVVSVDYRLAPEHPFPAAVDDARAAVDWTASHAEELGIDPGRLVVCGDSAGGNLATVTAIHVRGTPTIAAQVLFYPVTSFDMETASCLENREGYFLSRSEMQWFTSHYLGDLHDMSNPDAAPLMAPHLEGLPPTYLLTVGYDPLRDDGRAYAQRLIAAGVTTHFRELGGLIHGFMRRLDDFSAATTVLHDVAAFLDAAFRR